MNTSAIALREPPTRKGAFSGGLNFCFVITVFIGTVLDWK